MSTDTRLLTDEQLAAIVEREGKATPGPWAWDSKGDKAFDCFDCQVGIAADNWGIQHEGFVPEELPVVYIGGVADIISGNTYDARFIAHSRKDIPRLLGHIQAQAERAREEAECRHVLLEACREQRVRIRALEAMLGRLVPHIRAVLDESDEWTTLEGSAHYNLRALLETDVAALLPKEVPS